MKISWFKAIFFLIFRPGKLIEDTEADYKRINTPEAIEERQRKYRKTSQSNRSINRIRSALFCSFLLVLFSIVAAFLAGKIYYVCGGVRNTGVEEVLQYSGIGILLWATLGKVGWSIQTSIGNTIPELVNEWVFRFLYVIGSFLLVFSVSLTFGP
jgi:hypothetical protein